MSEDNPQILAIKKAGRTGNRAENRFRADWRGNRCAAFCGKGATVIMHSGTGEGMHADGEYVVWQSVEELARIQIEYLKESGECLKREEIPGSKGGKRSKTGVSPLCGRWRRKLWKKEISCVSGEGLAFAGRHLIYRNLLRFGSRAASSKIAAFTELRWLRY